MTRYNSSLYRACPLAERIGGNPEMLKELLDLVMLDGTPSLKDEPISDILNIRYSNGSDGEMALRPPKEHLIWMVNNFDKCKYNKIENPTETNLKRNKLLEHDKTTIEEAVMELDKIYEVPSTHLPSKWFVLEGESKPDIFIDTPNALIVIEAKWTEPKTTDSTTFLTNRSQIVRHIQGAIEYRNSQCETRTDKSIIAFCIVDNSQDNPFPTNNKLIKTCYGFKQMLEKETAKIPNQEEILSCYKGYTTWQEIEKHLGIAFLPKSEIDKYSCI